MPENQPVLTTLAEITAALGFVIEVAAAELEEELAEEAASEG